MLPMTTLLVAVLVCTCVWGVDGDTETEPQLRQLIREQSVQILNLNSEMAELRTEKNNNAELRKAVQKLQDGLKKQLTAADAEQQDLKDQLQVARTIQAYREGYIQRRAQECGCSSVYPDRYLGEKEIGEMEKRMRRVEASIAGAGKRNSFLADLSFIKDDLPTDYDIIFDRVRYDRSSSYDPSTGEYTVPVYGIYLFNAVVVLEDDADNAGLWVLVDDAFATFTLSTEPATNTDFSSTMSVTAQLLLSAGQKVKIRVNSLPTVYGKTNGEYMRTWFSGHLIEP